MNETLYHVQYYRRGLRKWSDFTDNPGPYAEAFRNMLDIAKEYNGRGRVRLRPVGREEWILNEKRRLLRDINEEKRLDEVLNLVTISQLRDILSHRSEAEVAASQLPEKPCVLELPEDD